MRRLHALWPTVLALFGIFAFFVGEYSFGKDEGVRWTLSGLGALLVLVALSARVAERSPDPEAGVGRRLTALHALLVGSLALYAVTLATEGLLQSLAWVACLVLGAVAAVPLILMEAVGAPVVRNPAYERARIQQGWVRGLGFGLLLPVLFLANFLAETHDIEFALAKGSQTRASERTMKVVEQVTRPVEVRAFFPRRNAVADVLRTYLGPIEAANSNIQVRFLDQAIDRELAKESAIKENGWVALVRGEAREKFFVGRSKSDSRFRLRKFDQDFLEALLKIDSRRKHAYFVEGHGERPFRSAKAEDGRSGTKFLADNLERLQYQVRAMGLSQGLQEEVPSNAEIVFIIGPETPFLEAEEDAILRALRDGARVFLALEPGFEAPTPKILKEAGITFDATRLANEEVHVSLTRSERDVMTLATNDYIRGPVTETLRKNAKVGTVFETAGSLVLGRAAEGVVTSTAIRAMPQTFRDTDGDLEQDPDEPSGAFVLAATATFTSTTGAEEDEGRLFVTSDADFGSDAFIQLVQGNLMLLRDSVVWLQRDDAPVVAVDEDDDVKIVHRKEEDALVFYGTTFLVPALLIGLGWLTRRRR